MIGSDHETEDRAAEERAALLDELRNGAWLDAQSFDPLAYAVPGLIPEGSVLLVGPPKIGKSWFVLACALAIASGGRALGQLAVEKRPVLYLALEDGDRRLQDRCRVLLEGDPIPEAFEYLTRVQPGRVVETISVWLGCYRGKDPVVILDTLGKVMPPAQPGESSYQRDYRIGSALKRVLDDEPGTTLVVNHHDRKAASEDFVDSVSGTHGLAGAADTIVVLTRRRQESSGTLKVTGRDVDENEYAVTFGCGGWVLDGADLAAAAENAEQAKATAGVGDRLAEVISFVAARPGGVRADAVAGALGLDDKQAGVYLGRAVKAGRLARPRRGLHTPVGSVGLLEDGSSEPNDPTQPTGGRGGRCERCGQHADRLVFGRCPSCAYPAGGAPDDVEEVDDGE